MVFTTTLPLTPTHGGIDVCLLDTAGKIAEVVALFKSNAVTTIAVDIEGRNLGRGGLIATIQLHAPESPTTVYVVDVVAVGATQTFSHETGLKELLESSQVTKLFFDGGSYDVWFTRPLSAILIEYLTDVHIFSHLLTALLPEDQRAIHRPAIERASSRRLNIAHALDFSKDNSRNKLVDDEPFIDEIVSNCSSSVRTRISNERAELLRIQALPVKDRVRTRGGGPSAMQEVSEALRGHRTIQPVILWDVVQFICAHNRWFSSEDYMAFLELAMSSYYLTIKQRQTCSDWRSRNGAHKNQRYTDDECYDYDDADSD
ncbi:hypothetical protein CAOG_06616 [Capsaspora owczarzaki ATCC 30864]|uniref:hypothetical protein n=1 Tax=Capsaspora owczarzaki (strain ATCC 30864) TaxID=595528 RepID=UPI0001FE4130|nr:hypothetical protein CAOG_06616 [Capsaspora owczarzaki ATCC 30864]|eukprot:XP_004344237.1 hypothetical protein CAOG_06616 [Capsaspora owczarzaki ATCC 30864]